MYLEISDCSFLYVGAIVSIFQFNGVELGLVSEPTLSVSQKTYIAHLSCRYLHELDFLKNFPMYYQCHVCTYIYTYIHMYFVDKKDLKF
jgi:hypothetical protein